MGANNRHRWFSFHHRSPSSSSPRNHHQHQEAPIEFLCPISGSVMSDPVVVPSGQTFERISVQVCRNLGFVPELPDGTRPDFSTVIPNLTMKSTILSWCDRSGTVHPRPPDYASVEAIVRAHIKPGSDIRVRDSHSSTSSDESVTVGQSRVTPPRTEFGSGSGSGPVFFSSSNASSSDIVDPESLTVAQNPNLSSPLSSSSSDSFTSPEEEEIYDKLKSSDIFDQEQGLIMLRRMTRTNDEVRVSLCTHRILSLLRYSIASRYSLVQTNAVASVVNLSLEKANKVAIVRAGFVPLLIDILKSGSSEAQEHAAGALFSLAVEDENKMAIGVLGAVQPLLHALRSGQSERTRQDSALALYHLTLNPTNRSKLVKLGAVPLLLTMAKSAESSGRVLLLLCHIAASSEGKAAMLHGNAVEILVGMLRDGACESESTRENSLAALLALSLGNLRFRGLAKEVGAVEVLKDVEERGSAKAKEKAVKILQVIEGGGEGGEAREWERAMDASGLSRAQYQAGQNAGYAYSSQF